MTEPRATSMSVPVPVAVSAEVNFDGLVGPTHNYAGLSFGNRASMGSAGQIASPRAAARQGLAKMRMLHHRGLIQGVLPPPRRPDPEALIRLGVGDLEPAAAVRALAGVSPALAASVMSASSMWAANAATVSPSTDTSDGRVHFTPANLVSTTHRSFEWHQTVRTLRSIFRDRERFVVHDALPSTALFADEGAANHGRFAPVHGRPGVELFVYGRDADDRPTGDFPRRQTRMAGELIIRSHGLDPDRAVFARQAASAIDAGAFHNDVVSVANETVLLAHESAFDDPIGLRRSLPEWVEWIEVPEAAVPLSDAIASYLFNSQLITLPNRDPGGRASMLLVAPGEVANTPSAASFVAELVGGDHPIDEVAIVDLRQSMRNGGGPACVRLRVVLTEQEREALSGRVLVDDGLLDELDAWVDRHYRDELTPADLLDPGLIDEVDQALDELSTILVLD